MAKLNIVQTYPKPKDEEDTIQQAMESHKEAYDAMDTDMDEWAEDLRFAGGDQWPEAWEKLRNEDAGAIRPCLVIDRLHTHMKQVQNTVRMSPPSIIVRPVDGKADIKTADIFTGIIRHIESLSMGGSQYAVVTETQVPCGVGYMRAYPSEDGEIQVAAIPDIFSVTLDPYAIDPYGLDASYWHITHDVPQDGFERNHPGVTPSDWKPTRQMEEWGWWTKKSVRICEWMRFEWRQQKGQPKKRMMVWRKLCAAKVLEEIAYDLKYIPIVRVPGEIIRGSGMNEHDGRKMRLRGMVHRSKDPQIRVNVTNSMQVEREALTPLPAPIGAAGQFAGHEDIWNSANKVSYGYREYNPIDVNGTLVPAPQVSPAVPQQTGLINSIQQAAEDLRATTGQGPASLDELTDTTSGVALRERRKSGDVATFHYAAHIQDACTVMGKILINMIPKVYSPKAMLRILGEDGEAKMVRQDASMDQSHKAFKDAHGHLQHVYNLTVGQYDVVVESGPSYATKRQEAAAGMKDILQGNPAIWSIGGHLLVKNLDWPGADELSKIMLKEQKMRMPGLYDDEESVDPEQENIKQEVEKKQQMVQAAQQQVQQLEQAKAILDAKAQAAKAEVSMQEKELELQAMKAQMGDMQMMAMQGQMDEQKLGALMQGQEMIAGNIARQVIDQTRQATMRRMKITPNPRDGSFSAQTVGRVKDEQTGLDLQIMARVAMMPDGTYSGEQVKVAEDGTVVSRKTIRGIPNADGSLTGTILGDE